MINNEATLFWQDYTGSAAFSYSDLIADLNASTHLQRHVYTADYYTVFKNILLAVLSGKKIILLDADFSPAEVAENLNDKVSLSDKVEISFPKIEHKKDLLDSLHKTHEKFNISLFTSGTTGRPKQITHNFASLTRAVRTSEKSNNNVWGFAYNPTHFAGLQVFFQALLNGNTLIRLFGTSKTRFIELVNKYQITHISATPTFYRLLLPPKEILPSVRRITFGGEKFDPMTRKALEHLFPNAKFLNVYASTEGGTLFATENGNVFTIKPEVEDKVKIMDGELFIHQSLLGSSPSFILKEGWFASGDLVEIISENPLKFSFISRKNEMINVGGYKVNPHEVESVLSELEGVKEVLVFARANSVVGSIVCCDLVVDNEDLTIPSIRKHLSTKLQPFKIPRIIKFVAAIEKTKTGKKSRKK